MLKWKANGKILRVKELNVFNLSPPPRYRLARAPLAQALVQVRFPFIARLQSAEAIAPIQDRLKDRYPYMNHRQEISLQMSSGPQTGVSSELVWELSNDDGWIVVIGSGSATLAVGSSYFGFDDFAERFQQVLSILADEAKIARCDRLGTRYLSIAENPPGKDNGWQKWFQPELTGWASSKIIKNSASCDLAMSQVHLRSEPDWRFSAIAPEIRAIVQHGLVPAGSGIPGLPPITTNSLSYILGSDLYVESPQPFDVISLHEQFGVLHSEIDAFFRWSLTKLGEEHFGLEEL